MAPKDYTIKQHLYNGKYGAGSVFENTIKITYFPAKESGKLSKGLTRSFADSNLRKITAQITPTEVFDNSELIVLLEKVTGSQEYLVRGTGPDQVPTSIPERLKNFSILFEDNTYDVPLDSEIGKAILEAVQFSDLAKMSNQDFINLITF
jgi:hypothetical protein